MGLIDELAALPSLSLGADGGQFIDADTVVDPEGGKHRIVGINAPETEKILFDEDGALKYKQGTAGGAEATEVTSRLANDLGFTKLQPQLDEDGNPRRDHFGRILSDLVDETGRSFSTELLKQGVFDPNKYTSEQDTLASSIGDLRRNQQSLAGTSTNTDWDQARRDILEGKREEGDKQLGFRQTALNEQQLYEAKLQGQGHLFNANDVQVRHFDRTIDNRALNPLSDSWNQGLQGAAEGAYGFLELLGEKTGWQAAESTGEAGVKRLQSEQQDYAQRVMDYKDVDGFVDVLQFVGNNAAMSLPYMAIGIAGTVGTGGIGAVTTAAALGSTAAIYAGQTWNEMTPDENGQRDARWALGSGVAQAALDRLGITGLVKVGQAPKKVLKDAVGILVRRGASKEVAEAQVAAATKKELAGFFKDSAKVAKDQLAAKALFLRGAGALGINAGGEAITEAGQETIGYLAAQLGSGQPVDFNELNDRITSAAVAGFALGGAFKLPSSATHYNDWKEVAYNAGEADITEASQSTQYAEEIRETLGYIPSVQQLTAENRANASSREGATQADRAAEYERLYKNKSFVDKVTDALVRSPELFKGSVAAITTADLQLKSPAIRKLADMFGGNLQRIYSGSNYESTIHLTAAKLRSIVTTQDKFYASALKGKRLNKKNKVEASQELYEAWDKAIGKDGKFDPTLIPDGPKKSFYTDTINRINKMSDEAYKLQKKYNSELGYEANYFKDYRAISKGDINKDRIGFQNLLQSEYGINPATAKELTDTIADSAQITDINEAFTTIKGTLTPGSHKSRTLNLSQNPKFQKFLEQDIYRNMGASSKAASRFVAHQEFVGKDGENISQILDEAQRELGGGPEAAHVVNKIAFQMKNYLDAQSGNYKRPQTDAGKKIQKLQKHFMFFTTMAALPLATLSSLPELGLSTRGLTREQIFGKDGSLKTTGKEFAKSLKDLAFGIADAPLRPAVARQRSEAQQLIDDLGYEDWDVGAATTVGATEVNPWHQEMLQQFFRVNQLQGWTQFTRAARGAIAGDFFNDKIQTIADQRISGGPKIKEVQQAEEALRNFGFDVDTIVEQYVQTTLHKTPLDEVQTEARDTMYREATYNFINDAVALPGSANRPLIYQDPRFALFTQFQGFMATFTANHIPKLWGEYIKRGSPAMKFNTYATMVSMIMLGFASQAMKDELKYGLTDDYDEEIKTGQNPYLELPQYLQRGVRSSGLLGTYERLLDKAFPLYPERSSGGITDWVFNETSDESPAISNLKRLASGVGNLLEGDLQRAGKKFAKSAPLVGPITPLTDRAGQLLSGDFEGSWKFKE